MQSLVYSLSACMYIHLHVLSFSSNCVVNLTPDKKAVLKEAYRVLKVYIMKQ